MLSLLKNLFSKPPEEPLNLDIFKNPLAEKVSWKPQKRGGSNYKSRKLVTINSQNLRYKPTTVSFVFSYLFLAAPFLFFAFQFLVNNQEQWKIFMEFPVVLSFPIFIIAGAIVLYALYKPIGFNKKIGYYYKSYKKPTSLREVPDSKKWVKLDDVKALQIIKERVKTKNSSFISYELNLVLKDASRVNVIDHSNYQSIMEDAQVIADFIGIPYWNAIYMHLYLPKTLRRQDDDLDTDYDSTPRFRKM